MANYRSASAGHFGEVTKDGQVSAPMPGAQLDSGHAGQAVAALFSGLAAQIGRMADRAAIRQGEDEGLAAGAAAGSGTAPARNGAGGDARTRVAGGAADLDHLSGSAKALLTALTGAGVVPELKVTSGYRDADRNTAAGGAKNSQHLHGNALDLDISGLTDQQKGALLQAAVAAGAKGVGIYGDGGSLHLDTRDTPATWGGDKNAPYQGHGADLAPEWARPTLTRLLAGEAPVVAATAPALKLRRDGTLRGDAYDAAAERAYGWRFAARLDAELADAWDAHKDDPAAFGAAVERLRKGYASDPNLADPRLRELVDREYAGRVATYGRDVSNRAQAKARADASAAADTQFQAAVGDLERRAYILGRAPDGDDELAKEVQRNGGIIDSQVAAGAISPAQGAQRKAHLASTAAVARVRGAYDVLPDLAAKEQFAGRLTEEWATGKGPLASLSYDVVNRLQNELIGKTRTDRAADTRANMTGRMELEKTLRDDVASLAATGAPVLVGGQELDPAEVAKVLGPERALRWADARQDAKLLHDATTDFGVLPEKDILTRVEALAPEPGSPHYAAQSRLYQLAQAKAKQVLDLRRSDPAAAVEAEIKPVKEAKAALNPADPGSYRRLAQVRMDAQQVLGIPETARQPLTRREATAIADQITRAKNPQVAALSVAREAAERYGDLSDEVLVQVLRAAGAKDRAAGQAAGLLRDIRISGGPTPARVRTSKVESDAGRAEDAASGAPVRPREFKEVPGYGSIQTLMDNPALASQFDARFGAGWSEFYLTGMRQGQERVRRGPHIAEDGSESWSPSDE